MKLHTDWGLSYPEFCFSNSDLRWCFFHKDFYFNTGLVSLFELGERGKIIGDLK